MTRVLMIDDDFNEPALFALIHAYRKAIEKSGMAVTTHSSLREAKHYIMCNSNTEDIVVLDMMMPVDFEVTGDVHTLTAGKWLLRHHLRSEDSHYRRTPVLILTNRDLSEVYPLIAPFDRVWLSHKIHDCPPHYLPTRIDEILNEAGGMS